MRILAIGDIHGCSTALEILLNTVQPQPEDKIITLGDYVDKGPDSKGVLEILLKLHHSGQLIALKGNHEQMMLRARNSSIAEKYWRRSRGDKTLASYSKKQSLMDIPKSHWDFLENSCINFWETETHLFVHASVDPNLPLNQQPEYMLMWGGFEESLPHYSGKTMICGHTVQTSGLPRNLGFAICIDTWVDGSGWLTCLDVNSGEIWQASQQGETRRGCLNQ
ncbi:MAG: serine/threonine protein phosphatase [Sphaerospermopsis sp. SIO1G1]|nr:serine/threonine protein phosphatase [Sphaerospermopsis sp. SIO1G1]